MLGPITARVWEIEDPSDLPYKLAAEEWSVAGLTLHRALDQGQARQGREAQKAFRKFLTGLVEDVDGDQSRKTERMLKRLAGALTAG